MHLNTHRCKLNYPLTGCYAAYDLKKETKKKKENYYFKAPKKCHPANPPTIWGESFNQFPAFRQRCQHCHNGLKRRNQNCESFHLTQRRELALAQWSWLNGPTHWACIWWMVREKWMGFLSAPWRDSLAVKQLIGWAVLVRVARFRQFNFAIPVEMGGKQGFLVERSFEL